MTVILSRDEGWTMKKIFLDLNHEKPSACVRLIEVSFLL